MSQSGRVLCKERKCMPTGIYKRKPRSEETKRKISKTLIGHPVSNETRKKLSEALTGRQLSEEHKRKISLNGFHYGMLGKKTSVETKKKISEALKGEKSYIWKGDNVGYRALHHWVRRELGKPMQCLHCDITDKEKKLVWANKDHRYKRNLDDFIPLCYSCHRKYDIKNN